MSRLLIAISACCTLMSACGEPVAPVDTFELPPADLSLDPERLRVGDYIATPCAFGLYGDRLEHLLERHEWALIDIFFGRPSSDDPPDGPNANELALVADHGGRVLYHFNVPAVRARMMLSSIPAMVEAGFWVSVRNVPDPTRYDVPVIVGFTRPVQDSDVEAFASLGGRVEHRFTIIAGLSGILPDRSIPSLRARQEVRYLEPNGVACLASQASSP